MCNTGGTSGVQTETRPAYVYLVWPGICSGRKT